ncbi:hypothetical protein DLAC_08823 [Tieghemostelium lacteum]|uniref:Uncharacterized protein n=1 Tax=Tieghemostelium lacteum TaxID=361077 RepID=A0A151Z8E6_TIELA|nr:hypothetical protein DLAC_08823 [Tieghemostelium lacteum]|eukprot:KYQ90222.1 hypothetical protein DLAC_08823 [Tieghemostelium lacteum]
MYNFTGITPKVNSSSKKSPREGRYIDHHLPSYNNESFDDILNDKVIQIFQKTLATLESEVLQINTKDYYVYTGLSGLSLLFWNMSLGQEDQNHYRMSKHLYEQSYLLWQQKATRASKKSISTFLEGDIGLQCIGCLISLREEKFEDFREMFNLILGVSNGILNQVGNSSSVSYELLYGVGGYLQGLIFLKKSLNNCVNLEKMADFKVVVVERLNQVITLLVRHIVVKGQEFSLGCQSPSPLMYEWHGSKYIGAAHGLAGIIYMLIEGITLVGTSMDSIEQQFKEEITLIKGTMDFVISCQLASGNFPSRKENQEDRLVQWCHGAPGIITTLTKCYQFFRDDKYLVPCKSASECLWKYGLLSKGVGLCHGISGNAFTFLSIFQKTKNISSLYQAVEFAKSCCSPQIFELLHIPDNPLSLFEGKGGLIWLLHCLIQLKKKWNE